MFTGGLKFGDAAGKARCAAAEMGWVITDLAWVAQLVERVLGKDEVTGSIPVPGSRFGVRVSRAGVTQR